MVTSLRDLASYYDDQHKHDQAEPLYKRILSIQEKAHGPDHPEVVTSLNHLTQHYTAHRRSTTKRNRCISGFCRFRRRLTDQTTPRW